MEEERQINHGPKVSVTVPERYFRQWLKEESKTTRLKIRCDFTKEVLANTTVLFILLLTGVFYREALIVVAPTVLAWILHHRRKRPL